MSLLNKRDRLPAQSDCEFYHSIDLPKGETISGAWDIRGQFDQYIGHYPLKGKTVLDVGTASGFLAFEAEKAGARVTALDLDSADTVERIPFRASLFMNDRAAWKHRVETEHLAQLANAFDYAHRRLGSGVERVFCPVESLSSLGRRFDIVIAGAVLEHLHNPVGAIGSCAHVANEAVIIAFTDVVDTDEPLMMPLNDAWRHPALDYSWWKLSRGLYRRVFENMGFAIEIVPSQAIYNPDPANDLTKPAIWKRHTIIARRIA